MIELKNVTKVYGKKKNQFTALKNVSLTIPTGASVAILNIIVFIVSTILGLFIFM